MSESLPPSPSCSEDYTYEQGDLLVCPMCGHEWAAQGPSGEVAGEESSVKDAVGNVLSDGDTVSVVKTLKVKGGGRCHQGGHQGEGHPSDHRRCGRA